jgi:hypothetical protein
MPDEFIDIRRDTASLPEPSVHLNSRASNESCNMLGDFLHHTGEITRGHSI